IPNTEVKLDCAESTWLDTAWEDRELPHFLLPFLLRYASFTAIKLRPQQPKRLVLSDNLLSSLA
ncbi:MAG: hypothetical protein J6V66_02230, partial [Clostridia bacterium]|nr:hypothetical protein [Clostridia bacterium]